MKMNFLPLAFITFIVTGVPLLTSAAEGISNFASLETHAFVSQGFIFSQKNNYLADSSKEGSFSFTEVGFNFTKSLSKNLRMGVQLFARDIGVIGNFDAKFDWFYLSYKWSDLFGISFGRIKLPFGLYNDASDIDSSRVAILLPQSLYPTQNRDFLLAQNGMELFGYANLDSAGALDYRLYIGTIHLDIENTSSLQIDRLNIPYITGGRVLWETPIEDLKVGGSLQTGRLETDLTFNSNPVSGELSIFYWVSSIEYVRQKLKIAAEYSKWHSDVTSDNAALIPAAKTISERAYILAEYRLKTNLQAGFYYSVLYPNINNRDSRENKQHDLAATCRIDFTENWLAKAEVHYMHGTASLDSSLNDDRSLSELSKDWSVFLLKTTAYF